MDYTIHGILHARILEWVGFPFCRGFSQPRNRTGVSCIAVGFFTNWAISEAHAGTRGCQEWVLNFPSHFTAAGFTLNWIQEPLNWFLNFSWRELVSIFLIWNLSRESLGLSILPFCWYHSFPKWLFLIYYAAINFLPLTSMTLYFSIFSNTFIILHKYLTFTL